MPTETPAQTYQRIFGKPWPGGTSPIIVRYLKELGITAKPGSAAANLALQKALLQGWRPGRKVTPRQLAPRKVRLPAPKPTGVAAKIQDLSLIHI